MGADAVPGVRRDRFTSVDADETTDFIERMYVGNTTTFDRVDAHGRFTADLTGVVGLRADRVRGDLGLRLGGQPLDYLLFAQLRRGRWDLDAASGPQARLGASDVVLYPSAEEFSLLAEDFDLQAVCLERSHLLELAEAEYGVDDVRFSALTPVSAAAQQRFAGVVQFVHSQLTAPDALAAHPLVAQALSRVAAAAVLRTFPSSVMTSSLRTPADGVLSATVAAAVDHMRHHAAQPITIGDVAAAVGVTPRALQKAFGRRFGVTPLRYLRDLRLDGARVDLLAADADAETTTTAVAARWGFSTRQLFRRRYREAFGETPEETLRR